MNWFRSVCAVISNHSIFDLDNLLPEPLVITIVSHLSSTHRDIHVCVKGAKVRACLHQRNWLVRYVYMWARHSRYLRSD